jgi:head-tail adaptor
MNPGKLDKRVLIKRQSKTADGFGGFSSTLATQTTIWANVNYTDGDITIKNGKRDRNLVIELIVRKKTADNIATTDLLEIENVSGQFQINSMFDSNYKYFTTITATKRE